MHEFVTLEVLQDGTGTAHGLGDEECGFLGGIVQRSGVELHKLQVGQHAACTVHHGHTVAGGDNGCGGGGVYIPHAAGGQECDLGQISVNLIGTAVKGIDTIAFDAGCVLGHPLAQMVLGDDVDGELMFL